MREEARSLRAYLTGEGRSFEEPVACCLQKAGEKTFAGMNVGERRTFHRLLAKVRANLDSGFDAR